MTILIVEDESSIRELMKVIVERKSHSVLAAGSARVARQIWAESSGTIDLVICDAYLGRDHGIELCEQFKAERPDLRVIICSGAEQAHFRNSFEFLPKPFTPSELLGTVERGELK